MKRGLFVVMLVLAAPHRVLAEPLEFPELLESLSRHHPRVTRELARVDVAEGELEAARGAFDPRATLRASAYPNGYYNSTRVELSLEALTPAYGLSVFGGYRLTDGYVPLYDGRAETLSRGELRLGVRMPLLQDLTIDAARAGRTRASIDLEVASGQVDATTLEIARLGAQAYFRWVIAGRALGVTQRMLELAETRNVQLQRLAAAGSIALIEARENERVLHQRRARAVVAAQRMAQAAVQLSLYLRDSRGAPLVVDASRLPTASDVQSALPASTDELLAEAVDRRPEIRVVRSQVERALVNGRLARNGRLPRLDAQLAVSRDLGSGTADQSTRLSGSLVEASLTLTAPVPNRTGTGRADAREADVAALDAELTFAMEQVATQVEDARLALVGAATAIEHELASFAAASDLARAEWRRFEEGSTSLVLVTLREQTAAEAELSLAERTVELDYARVQLDLAVGRLPSATRP